MIPFRQSADYYMQKGTYYNGKNRLSKALLFLQKTIEIDLNDPQNHYNLACLLSKTGNLSEANLIFEHIVEEMDPELGECYFFMAVNYGLMEELELARKYLLKYLELDPEGDMAEEAEDLLYAIEEEDELVASSRGLGPEENEAMQSLVEELKGIRFKARLLEEKELLQTLKRGLYGGSDMLKEAIISLLGDTACTVAGKCLADFAANPWVNERLRQVALLELKRIAPGGKFRIYSEGRFREVQLHNHPLPAPVWQEGWQKVLECTIANMRRSRYYSEEFFEDVEAIWIDFINRSYPDGPRVGKPQTWAAGLEYCLARFHFLGLTQKELAGAYGVSAASVGRKFTEINSVLDIQQKAYRNMLSYFSRRD